MNMFLNLLLQGGRFTAPVRILNCRWRPKQYKSYYAIYSAVFIALHIHCMYWPFTYEAKLTVMKETENCTCKYIATKSKSEPLYVWNNARCPCRSRLKLGQRLITFVNAAWIQSVKTPYPLALTTFSGIVFPL